MRVMRVEPAKTRISIEKSERELRIAIHARGRSWLAVWIGVVACAWCTGVGIGLLGLVKTEAPLPFVILLSLMLLVGLLGGASAIAWELAGVETITVTRGALLVSRSIGAWVRSRRYELAGTSRLRIPLDFGSWWAENYQVPWEWRRGTIQFDYHGRKRRMGTDLRVPEAQAILALIEPRVANR